MKGKKIFEELSQADEKLVEEAAESIYCEGKDRRREKKRRFGGAATAAALVAVCVGIGTFMWYQGQDRGAKETGHGGKETGWESAEGDSSIVQVQKVKYPSGRMDERPDGAYLKNLKAFYQDSIRATLTSRRGENRAYSPVNLYLCMAMLTEMTGGDTKKQLMDALGQKEVEEIRKQSRLIWERVYMDNSVGKCILSDSIWLNQNILYQRDVLEVLAKNYFTETYQGAMGPDMDKRIQDWVSDRTNTMLKKETDDIQTDLATAFVLLSTAYFHDQWITPFSEEDTEKGIFTNAEGEKETCDFMHQMDYGMIYETDRFQSTSRGFENGNSMYLYVPREGVTVEELLEKDMDEIFRLCSSGGDNDSYGKVTLSLPKFTVTSNLDLIPMIKEMGVTDMFDDRKADFTNLVQKEGTGGDPVYVGKVKQAAKASVDEIGCSVASYTEVELRLGAGQPTDQMEIHCDRPFLFIISNHEGIPIFAGVVNRIGE